MSIDLGQISLLARREIEARIAGPLIKAFMEKFGKEKTFEVVEGVIKSLASESGAQLAKMVGGNSLEHFAKTVEIMSRDDALVQVVLEQDEKKFYTNCTRCRFAEMYKQLGMPELGFLLSCGRDFAMTKGFNPKLTLKRTQTIMEGAEYCDFRFHLED
jgi:fumarate reductase iron-sulfur subunit